MSAAKIIAWFLVLLFSMHLVFTLVGLHRMVQFFPEGRRWWILPAQLVSLAIFAAVVLNHPF